MLGLEPPTKHLYMCVLGAGHRTRAPVLDIIKDHIGLWLYDSLFGTGLS